MCCGHGDGEANPHHAALAATKGLVDVTRVEKVVVVFVLLPLRVLQELQRLDVLRGVARKERDALAEVSQQAAPRLRRYIVLGEVSGRRRADGRSIGAHRGRGLQEQRADADELLKPPPH